MPRPYFATLHTMSFRRYRIAAFISLLLTVPIGYWIRFSDFLGAAWLHDALGSVAYEMFWILLVICLVPTVAPIRVAIAVFLATGAIELLQLWQPPWLQAIRATLPGRLVLGNSFSPTDFLAYLVGSLAGWGWVIWLKRVTRKNNL
jgi:hypothetical protein